MAARFELFGPLDCFVASGAEDFNLAIRFILAAGRKLPLGLQKRLEPLPVDLDRRLPRLPENWARVVVERDVVLLDRRTNRILDAIETVLDIVNDR